jgi:hypothetical protein
MDLRNESGIKARDALAFCLNAQTGSTCCCGKPGPNQDLRGMLKYAGPATTIEEMNQAIADHLGEEDERIQREWWPS